ncbi:MAG: DNA cytosine methyltransferase [Deltaproteobacteria bacterium]|nr:DNA cytosine methyltransferase [Deltaproteobacteria bacterium]
MINDLLGFYDFFAGGGLARLGLGPKWRCLMANDICPKKAKAYRMNFPPANELILEDVAKLTLTDLPGNPMLAWASFPCQDLSHAGNRNGLEAKRSGTFWPFWRLMKEKIKSGGAIPIIILENVVGALTSNKGQDLQAILGAFVQADYQIGLLVIDAVFFLPQSRPRLFFIAVRKNIKIPNEITQAGPSNIWHPKNLQTAYNALPAHMRSSWLWWRLPHETKYLLSLMSEVNSEKVKKAQSMGRRVVGTLYKRTRRNKEGEKNQRAEVRFDQISGCLRTSIGGSSRQTILIVKGESIKSRLLSPREAARLMGAPDSFKLPDNYNEAYHLMGDGLAVPVVAWIEKHILYPLIIANINILEAA